MTIFKRSGLKLLSVVFAFCSVLLAACGGGSGSSGAASPKVLAAGTTTTLAANSEYLVPSGAIISGPNNTTLTINGSSNTINVAAGSVVTVPATATGAATNQVDTETSASATTAPTPTVSVIAGSATTNTTPVDGAGTAAVFRGGGNMVFDPVSGNLFVSDIASLRQVTTAGQVTTLDRTDDWTGLAVDASGNLYGSSEISTAPQYPFLVKRTPAGAIQTLISANTTGPAISLSSIVVDASGNIYGADTQNRQIIRITPAGAISVFAGSGANGSADGAAAVASFADPTGLAFDPAGNLWVADHGNGVREISPAGAVTTVMPAPSVSTITVDRIGNVYASSGFNLIRIDTTGKQFTYYLIVAAQGSNFPGALATDSSGALYMETVGQGAQILKITFK